MERLPFDYDVFKKVLPVVFSLVLIGFVIAFQVYGELLIRDIIGTLISAVLGAYLIHLWLLPE